jgi:UDP-N-acetyl-D-galactosamine dehydrogenase
MHNLPDLNSCCVAVIGLGYVGLPLAVELAKPQLCKRKGVPLRRRVIGFDIDKARISQLQAGYDRTLEISTQELNAATLLELTSDCDLLADAEVYIVTVPTPIDSARRPDLAPLERASCTVGKALKDRSQKGSRSSPIVIYESTVYPGATVEVCVPILESCSGLRFNDTFFCGYSPERINPGDTEHKLTSIIKVTSGSTPIVASWVDNLYGSIIEAGTHLAPALEVAEAAKVIENTQRDLNIALVNELAIIFRYMSIDTQDVLDAAGTKWNFLPFRPGLVGGHCIGVDPYYLTHKAEQLGYTPQIVLAGRRINDGMGRWLVDQLVLEMARRGLVIAGVQVLILGLTFKENCPDMRNTRVVDLLRALQQYGMEINVVDPWADPQEALRVYGLKIMKTVPQNLRFLVVIAAVAHQEFSGMSLESWSSLIEPEGVYLDLKGLIPRELHPLRL